jgi:RNA polymerase sigma-70 factor (ECF subfamily)
VAPDPLDDAVARLESGDESAFREVYRAIQPPLLRYLTVLVGPVDAEDVASEAWAQALRDLDRFSGNADGFRGWVTTIGRHRALDHLRRRQRQPQVEGDLELVHEVPDPTDVEGIALGGIASDDAVALIASLPVDQAEAIMLRTVLGFDAPTAARILGKRPGAVRSASLRGLRALERRLAAEPEKFLPEKFWRPGRNTSDPDDAEGVT